MDCLKAFILEKFTSSIIAWRRIPDIDDDFTLLSGWNF